MKTLLLLISVLAISNIQCQQAPSTSERMEDDRKLKWDSLFDGAYKKGEWNGNVLIAEKGEVVYRKSFGKADYGNGRELDGETIFELASVSKQFTAMGIMILVKQGKLGWEDSLRKFFPGLPYSNITVRQLLNHSSGLPDYMELFRKYWDSSRIATNDDMIRLLSEYRPDTLFSPGRKWAYSNTGYAILASIIKQVSGKSYGDFLSQNIFEPLGMKRTLVYSRRYEKRELENYAKGYVYDASEKKYVVADDYPPTSSLVYMLDGIQGDGCVNSTVNDLLRWDRALYTDSLVPKEIMAAAFMPAETGTGSFQYGFGWSIVDSRDFGKILNHSGGWPGYSTFIERHISNDKLIILLQNNGKTLPSVEDIRRILYHQETGTGPGEPITALEMEEYVGEFELAPGFVLSISVKGGKLFVQATGQGALPIFRQKADQFFLKAVDARLHFFRDEKGKVNSLTLLQNGQEINGKKIHTK